MTAAAKTRAKKADEPEPVHNVVPELEAFLVPIDTVAPHPDNARVGDVDFIAGLLAEHGQYQLAVADAAGLLAVGNHRWRAAKKLGWTHFAVVQRDLDPEQARRLRLADNRSSDRARYDDAALLAELNALVEPAGGPGTAEGLDALGAVGFDQMAFDGLQRAIAGKPAAPPPDDFRDPEAGMTTDYQCPQCEYEWSGQPKPTAAAGA